MTLFRHHHPTMNQSLKGVEGSTFKENNSRKTGNAVPRRCMDGGRPEKGSTTYGEAEVEIQRRK